MFPTVISTDNNFSNFFVSYSNSSSSNSGGSDSYREKRDSNLLSKNTRPRKATKSFHPQNNRPSINDATGQSSQS